jgi:hypothetical protein
MLVAQVQFQLAIQSAQHSTAQPKQKSLGTDNIRIDWLTALLNYILTKSAHLKLGTDDHDLRNNRDLDGRCEARELQVKIVAAKDRQPQERNHTRGSAVNHVPYDDGKTHGHDGTSCSAEKAKEGLPRSYSQKKTMSELLAKKQKQKKSERRGEATTYSWSCPWQ